MNFKALLTTLALGATTLGIAATASAAPRDDRSARVENRNSYNAPQVVRDHRVTTRIDRTVVERPRVDRERFERPIVRTRIERPEIDRRWEQRRPIVERRVIRPIVRERFDVRPVYQTPIYEQSIIEQPSYVNQSAFVNGQLSLGLGGAACNSIEFTSNGGSSYVQQVAIQYADGRTQLVDVARSLDASNPSLDIQTDGSAVNGVTIYGQGAAVSAFTL